VGVNAQAQEGQWVGARVLFFRTLAPTWEGSFWASSIRWGEGPLPYGWGSEGWWVEGRLEGRKVKGRRKARRF
jgi:hypothetical protein